jgi:hypothetical protein
MLIIPVEDSYVAIADLTLARFAWAAMPAKRARKKNGAATRSAVSEASMSA